MLRSRVISAKFGPRSGQHEVLRGVSAMVLAQMSGLYEVLSFMVSSAMDMVQISDLHGLLLSSMDAVSAMDLAHSQGLYVMIWI